MGVESDAQEKLQPQDEPQAQGHDSTQGTQTESEEAVSSENATTNAATNATATETAAAVKTATAPAMETVPAAKAAPETDWQAKLDAKDAEMADMKVGYELQLAGAKNVKAAKALLGDHKGDIAALKEAEPWLFEAAAAERAEAPAGKTGLSNAGAATDEGAQLKRFRRLAGLEDEDD